MRRLVIFLLFILIPAAGVALLGRQLAAIYQEPVAAAAAEPARFPPALAGARFRVPADAGFHRIALNGGTLLVEGPHRTLGQARVSLCDQRANPKAPTSPLIPLYIGWDWQRISEDHRRVVHLKNALLDDGPGGVDAPAVILDTQPAGTPLLTTAAPEERLRLVPRDSALLTGLSDVAPASGSGATAALIFRQDAWLFWDAGATPGHWRQALRVQRLPKAHCPVGQIQVTVYGPPDEAVPAQATRRLRFYPPQGPMYAFQWAPGDYALPAGLSHAPEDADLFAAATAAGLIRVDRARHQATIAPADLPRRWRFAHDHPERLVAEPGGESWSTLDWNAAAQATHRLLHHSPAGGYLRQQMDIFNSRRLLAAVRLRAEDDATVSPGADPWQADWRDIRLPLTETMPLLAGGLFAGLPLGWEPWQRIEHWPDGADAATPVRFTLPLAPRPTRQRLQLLVVGRAIRLEGARLLGSEPRCLTAAPCQDTAALAYELRLQIPPNTARLMIQFQPLPAPAALTLFRRDFAHIRLADDGQLRWQMETPTVRRQRSDQRAQVALRDRDGTLLWDETGPTAEARNLGLGALVGFDPHHQTAVAGVLARLGERGTDAANARLTLDSTLQRLARDTLLKQLPEVAARFGARDPYQAQRFASLVVLDADQGDILAAVSLPEPPQAAAWADLYHFNAAQPRRGPLRWWAWQHDGGNLHVPGSTFKLLSALALERSAQHNPELTALLDGLEPGAIAGHPLAMGYDFGVQDACYPAHQQPCVHNFGHGGRYATLATQVSPREPRYGLEQALRDSLNTWFAWLVETTDATLIGDPQTGQLLRVHALTPAALNGVRPLAAVTAALGFGVETRLDGGLLPADALRSGDILLTTASRLDPIQDRHQIRLAALGFRMQVTPLQMARVAASIATEQTIQPRLLLELNGRTAGNPGFAALGIPTQRIRQGMKRVPVDGTARGAFGQPEFAVLRPALYAKTGTADLTLPNDAPANNAWLAGWVEPGGIPGEQRRLAFACQISHTRETGGAECGEAVANFLKALAEITKSGT